MSNNDIDYKEANQLRSIGYRRIVRELWPYECVDFEQSGSYEGTYYFLLRRGDDKFGICSFGYGSCTGCDFLQGTLHPTWGDRYDKQIDDENVDDIEQFFENERRRIVWKHPGRMAQDLSNEDNVSRWNDQPQEEWIESVFEAADDKRSVLKYMI